MLYPVTAGFIAVSGIAIILYDIWVVWKKGGTGTISWTLMSWWLLHPWFMVCIFGLMGHLFWPVCATASGQHVNAYVGTTLGVGFSILIAWEVFTRWMHDQTPAAVSRAYIHRLVFWAALGFWAGHQLAGQMIVCTP